MTNGCFYFSQRTEIGDLRARSVSATDICEIKIGKTTQTHRQSVSVIDNQC